MSTLQIFDTTDEAELNKANLYKGMGKAAAAFKNSYATYAIKGAERIFEETIYDLIKNQNCTVRYKYGSTEVTLDAKKDEDAKPPEIFIKGDDSKKLSLKADFDDSSSKKVVMSVPEVNVDLNAQYLTDAVTEIKNSTDPAKNKAFLLGLILFSRCR